MSPQVSAAATSDTGLQLESLAWTFAIGLGVHILFVALNAAAASLFRMGGAQVNAHTLKVRRAVIITASQKTLPGTNLNLYETPQS
jgi:hypothetical protein